MAQQVAEKRYAVWQCACVEMVISAFSVWSRIVVELSDYISQDVS